MGRGALRTVLQVAAALLGTLLVVPTILLLRADDKTLSRWADIGQAVSPIGIFFSGLAFIGIALTLALQRRELQNQREELGVTREEQQHSNEVALRQLHTDLIKLALSDAELLEVWPPIEPGLSGGTRKGSLLQSHSQPPEGCLRSQDHRVGGTPRRPESSHGESGHVRILD